MNILKNGTKQEKCINSALELFNELNREQKAKMIEFISSILEINEGRKE